MGQQTTGRVRTSKQQRAILTALAITGDAREGGTLNTAGLWVALFGEIDRTPRKIDGRWHVTSYHVPQGQQYASMWRSLARLGERGMIHGYRREYVEEHSNGCMRRREHPRFCITDRGREHLAQVGRETLHADFLKRYGQPDPPGPAAESERESGG